MKNAEMLFLLLGISGVSTDEDSLRLLAPTLLHHIAESVKVERDVELPKLRRLPNELLMRSRNPLGALEDVTEATLEMSDSMLDISSPLCVIRRTPKRGPIGSSSSGSKSVEDILNECVGLLVEDLRRSRTGDKGEPAGNSS